MYPGQMYSDQQDTWVRPEVEDKDLELGLVPMSFVLFIPLMLTQKPQGYSLACVFPLE